MRTIFAIAALLTLGTSACGPTGPDLPQSADQCRYGSRPFVEAWPCLRDTFATRKDDNPGIQAAFLAKGDLIWQRAKEGQISEEQARAEVRLAAAEARAAEDQSNAAASANNALVLSRMRPYTPPPVQPAQIPVQPAQTQTILMPSGRMVNCTTIGTVTNCY